jgi:Zn-finger nucleic acid-binding protein
VRDVADAQPFHFTNRQPFAEATIRRHHHETLYAYGEYAIFVALWHAEDFDLGLVGRCPVCYASSRVAQAYGQGERNRCPSCFGTTFEGGYRLKVIRPAIFTDRVTDTADTPRGSVMTDQVTIETTEDFTFRHGDYVIRRGNIRYSTEEKGIVVVRSGFGEPQDPDSIAGTISSARLEDRVTSPAYLVPPTSPADVEAILNRPVREHLPPDLSVFEDIRGPVFV